MIASAQASEGGFVAKSRALFEVVSTIEAARYDLPVSYEVSESALSASDVDCYEVAADEVVEAFTDMLSGYQEVFPDEELPYEQATNDFAAMVGEQVFVRCEISEDEVLEVVKSISFHALDNSFKVTFLHHLFK